VGNATVKFCPGARAHYEFSLSGGFCDYTTSAPGVSMAVGEEHTRGSAALGAGRLSLPQK
jgi:hypothetical protein